VNNNYTDHTAEVVLKHISAGAIPGLRSVQETRQDLNPPRVSAVYAVQGRNGWHSWTTILSSSPDWIVSALAFAGSHPETGAFGGEVSLNWEVEPPFYVRGYLLLRDGARWHFLWELGLSSIATLLRSADGSTDRCLRIVSGKALVSGGDVEFVLRISAAGYALWYVRERELHPRIPLRRTSPPYFRDINRNLGISQTLADALVYRRSSLRWILHSLSKAATHVLGLLRLAIQAARRSRSLTDISIQASFNLGQLLGIWRIFRMPPARNELLGRAVSHGVTA
jgi:hypothetical protein